MTALALLLLALGADDCRTDADCTVMNHPPEECCVCKPGKTFAISVKEAARRSQRCATHGKCDCRGEDTSDVEPDPSFKAVCKAKACVLTKR